LPGESDLEGRIRSLLPDVPDLGKYDLNFRPESYWKQPLESIQAQVRTGYWKGIQEINRLISEAKAAARDKRKDVNGAVSKVDLSIIDHVELPDFSSLQVGIASCSAQYITNEVARFYAQPGLNGIHYRIISLHKDDLEDLDNVTGPFWTCPIDMTPAPLTLGELICLVTTVKLEQYKKIGFDCHPDNREFFVKEYLHLKRTTSDFYPDLYRFFSEYAETWLKRLSKDLKPKKKKS
jgi:hypothetical protein